MSFSQLDLDFRQKDMVRRCYSRAFSRLWGKLETRLGAMSGETLEALLHGLCRYLACRYAGRLLGYSLEARRNIRPRNLDCFFVK